MKQVKRIVMVPIECLVYEDTDEDTQKTHLLVGSSVHPDLQFIRVYLFQEMLAAAIKQQIHFKAQLMSVSVDSGGQPQKIEVMRLEMRLDRPNLLREKYTVEYRDFAFFLKKDTSGDF